MAYGKTAVVIAGTTDVLADQYNSMMAEMKSAVEGIATHDVDMVFTYAGGTDGDLVDTVTITDNSPAGDAGFDITGIGTWAYTGDTLNSFTYVFSATEMNITMTETYTYTGDDITTVGRTIS